MSIRSSRKSQSALGIVLSVLVVTLIFSFLAFSSITGFFTFPFVREANRTVCHNYTYLTNCVNETLTTCWNEYAGTKMVCSNRSLCWEEEACNTTLSCNNETGCEEAQTCESVTKCGEREVCEEINLYEPRCEDRIEAVCDEETVEICENETVEQINFTFNNESHTEGDVVISRLTINPRFGECDDNYTIDIEAYHTEGMNFSLHLWVIDTPSLFAKVGEESIGSGTGINKTESVHFELVNLCDYNLSLGTELLINSSTIQSSSEEYFVSGLPIVEGKPQEAQGEPEIIVKKVDFQSVVEEGEEFDINVFLTSYYNDQGPFWLSINSSRLGNKVERVEGIKKDELFVFNFRSRASSCGEDYIKISVYNETGEISSKALPISILCESFSIEVNKTASREHMDISILNASDGYFFERDLETLEMSQKRYIKIYMSLINSLFKESGTYDFEDRIAVNSFLLADEFRNIYQPAKLGDIPVLRHLKGEDFSAGDIHPQTEKKGYLVFSEIDALSSEFILEINSSAGMISLKFNSGGGEIV